MDFSLPVAQVILSEFIHHRDIAQVLISRIFFCKTHGSQSHFRIADGHIHPDANGIDSPEWGPVSCEIDPAGMPGLVIGSSHGTTCSRGFSIESERYGKFVPAIGDVAHHPYLIVSFIGGETHLETLGCGNHELKDNKFVLIPGGR